MRSAWVDRLRSVAREPLTAFVALGAACFIGYSMLRPEKPALAVTQDVIHALSQDYELLNGRAPDSQELAALVDKYVSDELLFRAALDQGLQFNDPKMKQRLIEKMRFLLAGPMDEPSREDLVNFYADNVKLYYSDRKLTFEQVFFEQAPRDSQDVAKRLRSGERLAGDAFWLGRNLDAYGESTLRSMLGASFVDALRAAPLNEWAGPIRSPRGVHYVRMKSIVEPGPIPYEQVSDQVEERWFAQRRGAAVQQKLEALRKAYDVKVEG